MSTAAKCATCQHIGVMYHYSGFHYDHMCAMSDERRKEQMLPGADFFDHFRAFFDATADQSACKRYVERPIANDETVSMLKAMTENKGRGEFKFFSKENRLAEKLNGKFIRSDMHARKSEPGSRVFWLLPVGAAEVKRASVEVAQ